jgi:CO/xanthine dehydrogenase FAD-binding subunit
MKPPAFEMARPETVTDALTLLAENEDAKLLAGGQSLVPVLNFRLNAPSLLIDLNRVAGLAGLKHEGGELQIGAMTRQRELIDDPRVARYAPLLAKAMPHVGHVQTRSRGTIGGSLAHADPSAELPLVMVALDATVTVQSRSAERHIPARAFFIDAMTPDLAADELLTRVAIPVAPPGARTAFREFARRHGDFAIVAVAAQFGAGRLSVAIGGLEGVPRLCAGLSSALAKQGFARDRLTELVQAELAETEPLSDIHADADYRRRLAEVLLADALDEVLAS